MIMKNHTQHSHSLAMILSGIVLTLTCLLGIGDITNGSAAPARSTRQDIREIREIIVHCSATPEGKSLSFEACRRDHVENRHFRDIGYHYYITRDGHIHAGRPEEQPGAHCKNHNSHSIGICYEGGLDRRGRPADTRTEAQKEALLDLIFSLRMDYPQAVIVGHHDLNPMKPCPCFDAAKEYLKN